MGPLQKALAWFAVLWAIPKVLKRMGVEPERCTTVRSYDRFRGVTFVVLRMAPVELGGWMSGPKPLRVYALSSYAGEKMTDHPDQVALGFSADGSDVLADLVCGPFFLLVDEEIRLEFGEPEHLAEAALLGPDVADAQWVRIGLADFRRIAGASRKLEAKLDKLEFTFSDEQRECLRKYLDEITPVIVIRKSRSRTPGAEKIEAPVDEGS